MIYLDMPVQEVAEKHHFKVAPKCGWGCNAPMKMFKGFRTKSEVGIEFHCETCECKTYSMRLTTKEAIEFWNKIV